MMTITVTYLIRMAILPGLLISLVAGAGIQEAQPPAAPALPGVAQTETAVAIEQPPAKVQGFVARAQFTRAVENREPVDDLKYVPTSLDRVYFFTEFRGMTGQTVTHRWEYEGQVVAEVKMKIGGPRWRAYSSKYLPANRRGKWTVVVLDEQGWPIKASHFEYGVQSGR